MTYRRPIQVAGAAAFLLGAWLLARSHTTGQMIIRREYDLGGEVQVGYTITMEGRRERTGRVTWPPIPLPTIRRTGEREWTIDFPGELTTPPP